MPKRNTSMLLQLQRWYKENPPKMRFGAASEEEAIAWQKLARESLRALLGIDRLEREEGCSVEAEVVVYLLLPFSWSQEAPKLSRPGYTTT